jgi:hypothetical protein
MEVVKLNTWLGCTVCKERDRLDIPYVNKNDVIHGAGKLGKNDITQGKANSTGMPPDPKCKQSRVTNLSLYKQWLRRSKDKRAFDIT